MSSPRRILEGSNATQTIKHSIFDVVRLRHFLKSCTRVFIRLKAFSSMSVLGRWWWCIVGCNESLQFKNIVVCLFPPPLFSCRTVNLRWNSFRSQSSESTLHLPSIHFGGTKVDRHSILSLFRVSFAHRRAIELKIARCQNQTNVGVLQFFSATSAFHRIPVSLHRSLIRCCCHSNSFRRFVSSHESFQICIIVPRGIFQVDSNEARSFPGSLPLLSHPAKDRSRLRNAFVYWLSFGQGLRFSPSVNNKSGLGWVDRM